MARELRIGSKLINDESGCYVIAEVGHNHQGSVARAKELFLAAKECGASAVKLQKRDNRTLYTRAMYEKPYENENSFGATYGEHREFLELDRASYVELIAYAREIGIDFFATAFDFPSADLLEELDMPAIKIASGDLTNIPLLRHVAATQRPIIISTGGATLEDVERAYSVVLPINPRLCIMQCTAAYPAAFSELNLRVISAFREMFPETVIGFSSHDNGIAMPLASYVLGARVIEKHFTLDRASKGTDHAFSLERPGLRRLVRDLHNAHQAMGDGIKRAYPSEKPALHKMGKKLVAARDLAAGERLEREDIAIKSPNDGLPPYELDNIIGRVLQSSINKDDDISNEKLVPKVDAKSPRQYDPAGREN